MIWWILGGLATVVFVLILVFAVMHIMANMSRAYVMREGERAVGWIVQANSALYEQGPFPCLGAKVVISFGASADDVFMPKLAQQIATLAQIPPTNAVQAAIAEYTKDDSVAPELASRFPHKLLGDEKPSVRTF